MMSMSVKNSLRPGNGRVIRPEIEATFAILDDFFCNFELCNNIDSSPGVRVGLSNLDMMCTAKCYVTSQSFLPITSAITEKYRDRSEGYILCHSKSAAIA